MRLPKRLSDAVHFAAWCKREQQEPAAVARLLVLAYAAKRAGERNCNEGTDATHKAELRAADRFEKAAAELGYIVDWPGLWPVLQRHGQDEHLPMI